MECVWVVGVITTLVIVMTVWKRYQMRTIAASRCGENFDTFRDAFAEEDVPPGVLRSVYTRLQEWCVGYGVSDFPVRAEDNIADIYGMADEDLEDAVLEVMKACGRKLPPEEALRGVVPVVSVRDVVRFVVACPVASSAA